MTTATTPDATDRALRADAQRNRALLLESAGQAFAEHGTTASLEDVAKRAGVGIGTLYRHFPTRDALIEAAYRHGMEQLCDNADQLLTELPPDDALEAWMLDFVAYIATKRGLAGALKLAAPDTHAELFAYVHERLRVAIGSLIDAAATAGKIRGDVDGFDLIRALGGICMVSDQPGWQEQARRLVSLLLDGLRYGAPTV